MRYPQFQGNDIDSRDGRKLYRYVLVYEGLVSITSAVHRSACVGVCVTERERVRERECVCV